MSLTRADPAARTLAINPMDLTVRSVITTIDPDRGGDVVVPTGLRNADEFLLNPVVLWAHQRAQFPPIGVCEWIDIQPRRIVAQTKFARGVPFAEDVFRLYEQGVLRGWSIGFLPRKARRLAGGDPRRPPALRVDEWDLLEYSAVPIPENPAAVTVAIEKGLVTDAALCDWLRGAFEPRDVLRDLVG
ncbi:HK97 family phage prohead protease [Gemmata sp.]|uniref:HK97 family phage prohead protease n=1 Tax=Gemmata sp. TaxID=1914242 RepID=UPI003F6EE394